ncbi:hypothetical protein J437_LFUL000648 [Ladona fulva]|uniref:START domain-containing protein n=1 Tax=Ladona fulva TaxID=123851 RepID=A0A8K0K7W7_LADFU|nr:hypothetical protein J437_LFUL000648 [Ladona fulva]
MSSACVSQCLCRTSITGRKGGRTREVFPQPHFLFSFLRHLVQYLPSQIQMRFPGAENLRKLVFGHSSKDIVEVPVLSEEDYKKKGHEVLKEAWHLLNCDSWRLEKRGSGDTSEGGDACDEVFSMVHPGQKGKKIYRLRGRVEIAPKVLLDELFSRLENVPSWNPTILESHRIQTVDDHTDISYIVTAEGGGGLVSSRDFVNLRHWDVIDGSYISAGVSVTHPEKPPQKKYVRGENGPGCWAMSPIAGNPGSCSFQWLLDTNLKGWLTPIVVDGALTGAMFDYIRHLRKYAQKLNSSKGPSSYIMPISSQEEEQIAVNS